MQYIISFLEGIITFISPCLLPMLPIYISYFAGGGERTTGKTLKGALGFVAGFTLIFVAMGALAGTLGSFLNADSMERSKLYRIFSRFVSKNGFKQMSVARMSQLISTSKDILPQDKSDGKSYYYLRKVSDEE